MITSYLKQLLQLDPKLTPPIAHPHFVYCVRMLECLGAFDNGSSLIVITGPSQVGKSLLLQYFVRYLLSEIFISSEQDERPIIGAAANLAREGRTATKYLYDMLLGDAGSPLHDPQKLAQSLGYRPSRGASEASLLVALTRAMEVQNCRYVLVDEAQFMVRAKDAEFRASLVESIKSLVSYNRTAVLVGGYEIAKVVLEQREHLASRPTFVHFERYTATSAGMAAWLGILEVFAQSKHLVFEKDHLLADSAERLLEECHGQVGILQHRLVMAKARAAAHGRKKITEAILQEVRQTNEQWRTVRAAVELGESTMTELVDVGGDVRSSSRLNQPMQTSSGSKAQKPFVPKPTRTHKAITCE